MGSSEIYIPTVDLSSFAPAGNEEARWKASQDLYDACHTLGFANIISGTAYQTTFYEKHLPARKSCSTFRTTKR